MLDPEIAPRQNGFVIATILGTTNKIMLPQPKVWLQKPNILLMQLDVRVSLL